jgi:hypothetical protein
MIAAFIEAVERHEGDWKVVFDDLNSHAAFDEQTIKNVRLQIRSPRISRLIR